MVKIMGSAVPYLFFDHHQPKITTTGASANGAVINEAAMSGLIINRAELRTELTEKITDLEKHVSY